MTDKIVRSRRKALHCRLLVSDPSLSPLLIAPPPHPGERPGEHDGEVHDERDHGTENRSEVMQDVSSLLGEDDDDGIEEAGECERGEVGEEEAVEAVFTDEVEQGESGD